MPGWVQYGDIRHWNVTIFRLNVSRWCRIRLDLGGRVTHPVTVRLWNRAGSARER